MKRLTDEIIGEKHHRLTIVGFFDGKYQKEVLCKCDCGKMMHATYNAVVRGRSKSCGCYSIELNVQRSKKHGQCNKTTEYKTWAGIKERCYNKHASSFKLYGGRGIKMCDRWLDSFENFFADMGKKPTQKHSIDRIDVNGDYTPANCRWATPSEQGRNRRNNLVLTINGETKCAMYWSEQVGINVKNISSRIIKGWDAYSAVFTPIRKQKNNTLK